MAYNRLNLPNGVTLNANHLKHIEDGIVNAENSGTWAGLPDKPVVMQGGDTLTWDGNTEGKTPFQGCYKVSSAVFTSSDLTENTKVFTTHVETGETRVADISEFEVVQSGDACMVMYDSVFFLLSVGAEMAASASIETGTYFTRYSNEEGEFYISSCTIPGYTGFGQEKIAPSHLYQPDWNQNDATQPDYVKNRPFGETDVVVLDGTFAFEDIEGTIGCIFEDSNISFTNEQAVTVIWDGVSYSCNAVCFPPSQMVGDTSFVGIGEGCECPFLLMTEDGVTWIFVDTKATEPTSRTVQVRSAEISKLHEKYVPHTIIYIVNIDGIERLCWDTGGTQIITMFELTSVIRKPFWLLDIGASGTPRQFVNAGDIGIKYITGYNDDTKLFTFSTAYVAEYVPETT